jgi:hypothetical protein
MELQEIEKKKKYPKRQIIITALHKTGVVVVLVDDFETYQRESFFFFSTLMGFCVFWVLGG